MKKFALTVLFALAAVVVVSALGKGNLVSTSFGGGNRGGDIPGVLSR